MVYDLSSLDLAKSMDISSADGPSEARRSSYQAQSRRYTLVIQPSGYPNNESLSDHVCNTLNNSYTELKLTGSPSVLYRLPACVVSFNSLIYISLTEMHLESFAHLPSSVKTLQLVRGVIMPYLSSAKRDSTALPTPLIMGVPDEALHMSGFDAEGNFSWPEIWSLLPVLQSLEISSSVLRASLPARIPALLMFRVQTVGLTGTIPPDFLANYVQLPTGSHASFELSIGGNQLTGSIPPGLFDPLQAMLPISSSFKFNVGNNLLTGSLPPALLHPLHGLQTTSFQFFIHENGITGTLPSNFIPSLTAATIEISIYRTSLQGSIPSGVFFNITQYRDFYFRAAYCSLSGTLPASLFSVQNAVSPSAAFVLDLSHNQLHGSIPSTFLTQGLTQDAAFGRLQLYINNNQLSGTIPENLLYTMVYNDSSASFERASFRATNTFLLQMDYNQLEGSIPSQLVMHSFTSGLSDMSVTLSNNALNGTVPNLFAVIPTSLAIVLNADNNRLTGSLPSLCSSNRPLSYSLTANQLSGTIPSSWHDCRFQNILLSNNSNIHGILPSRLLNSTSVFHAANTRLNGHLPLIGSSLQRMDLKGTQMSFCSAESLASFTSQRLSSCALDQTSACNCSASYSSYCSISCPDSCTASTRPSDQFICVGGIWVVFETISTPNLTIPSGAGTVVVIGNLSTSTVVINGLDASVNVTGCIANLTTIQVELDRSQYDQLTKSKLLQRFITQSSDSNCRTDFSKVAVRLINGESGCKKAKVSAVHDGSTLSGLFSIDSSSCNTWWIILASVLGGVIVLANLTIILMAIFWPAFRAKLRPFSSRRKGAANVA